MSNFERIQERLFNEAFTIREGAEALGMSPSTFRSVIISHGSRLVSRKKREKYGLVFLYAFKDSDAAVADLNRRVGDMSSSLFDVLKTLNRAFTLKQGAMLCNMAPQSLLPFLQSEDFDSAFGRVKLSGPYTKWYAPSDRPDLLEPIRNGGSNSFADKVERCRELIDGRAVTRGELALVLRSKDNRITERVIAAAGLRRYESVENKGYADYIVYAFPKDEAIARKRLEELFDEWLEADDLNDPVPKDEITLGVQLFGDVLERYQELKRQKKREFRRYKSLSTVERLGRALGRNWGR